MPEKMNFSAKSANLLSVSTTATGRPQRSGIALLLLLLLVKRSLPLLRAALVVVVVSIVAVAALGLDEQGVAVLGAVPGDWPSLALPNFDRSVFGELLTDAAGIMLVSFTSGVLTAKSFATRNGYKIDAAQWLNADPEFMGLSRGPRAHTMT